MNLPHQKLGYKSPPAKPQMSVMTCLWSIKFVEIMQWDFEWKVRKSLSGGALSSWNICSLRHPQFLDRLLRAILWEAKGTCIGILMGSSTFIHAVRYTMPGTRHVGKGASVWLQFPLIQVFPNKDLLIVSRDKLFEFLSPESASLIKQLLINIT